MARAARDEGKRAADDMKNRAADRADEMARAADAAADELEKSGDTAISGYGHSLASMMRQFSGGLRDRDVEDFAAELAQFARRHPAAFLAGSVAVGFGLARVLKAQNGGSFMRHSSAESEFYGDYDEEYGEYDEGYEAGEYDSGGFGSEFGSAERDRNADSFGSRSSATGDGSDDLAGGRYTPGNTGASSASSASGYGGYGGTDSAERYGSSYGESKSAGLSSSPTSSTSSTTSSPTSAPVSSGTSSNRGYETASTGSDPLKARDESDDDNPIETPESDAKKGPRKGDLP